MGRPTANDDCVDPVLLPQEEKKMLELKLETETSNRRLHYSKHVLLLDASFTPYCLAQPSENLVCGYSRKGGEVI